jgi:hypothetical protein
MGTNFSQTVKSDLEISTLEELLSDEKVSLSRKLKVSMMSNVSPVCRTTPERLTNSVEQLDAV